MRCPFCAEEIQSAAVKCRHCGEWFRNHEASGPSAARVDAPDVPALVGESLVHGPPVPSRSAQPAPPARVNGLAIASFILALVGLLVGGILALVFGYRAKSQIDQSNGTQRGRGLAVAGIVLGWIQVTLLGILLLVVLAVATHKTPLEQAIAEGEEVAQSYANAQFGYISEHDSYAMDPKDLEEFGALPINASEEVRIAYASNDSYCMVAYLGRGESSTGYPYNITIAVWSYSPEEFFWARGWTCRGFPSTEPAPWTPPAAS